MKHFDSGNFQAEVLNSPGPVLVDFYADWCGPCHMMAPAFEKISESLGSQAQFGKLDVDKAQDIAERYQVMGIPTIILFKKGEPQARMSGFRNQDHLDKWIQAELAKA